MGRVALLTTALQSPRTDGRTYLGETAGPVTLSARGAIGTKESAAAAALPVARELGGRQQQCGVGLGLKDFLAASGNSEEGSIWQWLKSRIYLEARIHADSF